MRHAAFDGSSWITETLATAGPDVDWDRWQSPQLVVQDGKVYVLYADCTGYQASGDYPINLMLKTWDGNWSTETLYQFAGTCDQNLDYQLLGDENGRLVAVADITSGSMRPSPLLLFFWIAGGEVSSPTTSGAASSPVASVVEPQSPAVPSPHKGTNIYVDRGDGVGTLYIEDGEKYATYWDSDGYSTQETNVGTAAATSSVSDIDGYGSNYSVAEYSYDWNALYWEHIPQASPTLDVGLSGGGQKLCAPITATEEVLVTTINLSVDWWAIWEAKAVTLKALGTGDDQADVQKVVLRRGDTKLAEGTYGADNGSITLTFNPIQVIPAGGTLALKLYYKFKSQSLPLPNLKDFQVETKGPWVAADPVDPPYDEFTKLPIDPPVQSQQTSLFAVENETQDFIFESIQAAVAGADNGDQLVVCPGDHSENVQVNKTVKILALENAENTQVQAANAGQPVFNVVQPATANRPASSLQTDHVVIQKLGISGGTHGVFINDGVNNVQIGGQEDDEGTIITDYSTAGIVVATGSTGNSILGNRIYDDDGEALAIDLGNDGLTINDLGDGDAGANNLQNFPIITAVDGDTIIGTFNGAPNMAFRVELFLDSQCESGAPGDAETFYGSLNIATDAVGGKTFTFDVSTPIAAGQALLATATDLTGNTSELSPCPDALVFKVENDGDVYADGGYLLWGADFAELWPVANQRVGESANGLEPGDILALGPGGGVMLAGLPNAGPVVGIYATQPGLLAGGPHHPSGSRFTPSGHAPRIPVALVGIVPVKVSAENGAIHPGDLLTLSATPGVAARARQASLHGQQFHLPGSFFSKALEPFDGPNTGVIRVLLIGQ